MAKRKLVSLNCDAKGCERQTIYEEKSSPPEAWALLVLEPITALAYRHSVLCPEHTASVRTILEPSNP